jgi:hypothetical protein
MNHRTISIGQCDRVKHKKNSFVTLNNFFIVDTTRHFTNVTLVSHHTAKGKTLK